jgi:hypothetical protein
MVLAAGKQLQELIDRLEEPAQRDDGHAHRAWDYVGRVQ